MSTPYTYLIGWSHKNKYYYGSKYSKDADPKMLWKNYFTSSVQVKKYRNKYGEPDIIQIRRQFKTSDECRLWEHKVLRRLSVNKREDFLNLTYNMGPRNKENVNRNRKGIGGVPKGSPCPIKGKKACYNPETNKIFYISSIDELPEGFILGGPPKTDAHNLKNSLANKGKKRSIEVRTAMSEARKNKKRGSNNPNSRPVTIDDMDFGSVTDAAEFFGVSRSHIRHYEKYGRFKSEDISFICPHCNKETKSRGNLSRWHLDNCKHKKHDLQWL